MNGGLEPVDEENVEEVITKTKKKKKKKHLQTQH
jgi:hypothetical protein